MSSLDHSIEVLQYIYVGTDNEGCPSSTLVTYEVHIMTSALVPDFLVSLFDVSVLTVQDICSLKRVCKGLRQKVDIIWPRIRERLSFIFAREMSLFDDRHQLQSWAAGRLGNAGTLTIPFGILQRLITLLTDDQMKALLQCHTVHLVNAATSSRFENNEAVFLTTDILSHLPASVKSLTLTGNSQVNLLHLPLQNSLSIPEHIQSLTIVDLPLTIFHRASLANLAELNVVILDVYACYYSERTRLDRSMDELVADVDKKAKLLTSLTCKSLGKEQFSAVTCRNFFFIARLLAGTDRLKHLTFRECDFPHGWQFRFNEQHSFLCETTFDGCKGTLTPNLWPQSLKTIRILNAESVDAIRTLLVAKDGSMPSQITNFYCSTVDGTTYARDFFAL